MRRLYALLIILLVVTTIFIYPRITPNTARARTIAQSRRGQQTRRATRPSRPRIDYSKFSHRTSAHRLSCDRCHKIPTPNWSSARGADSFPDITDYPDHDACLSCHRQQFFTGARPVICKVCHTTVSPRDAARYVFRNPGEEAPRGIQKPKTDSQFAVNFPHDKHQDVMARLLREREVSGAWIVRVAFQTGRPKRIDSCSICHQTYQPQGDSDDAEMPGRPRDVDAKVWPKKGTFMTTPTGHASCFNCHWQEGGARPRSSDCAACHTLQTQPLTAGERKIPADTDRGVASKLADERVREKWLRRESARFRHEEEKHESIGCTGCHLNITSISTLDASTLEVPILTCGGTGSSCHIKPRPKAILNVEVDKKRADASFQCVKCHVNYGREPIPKSHSDPVPLPKP